LQCFIIKPSLLKHQVHFDIKLNGKLAFETYLLPGGLKSLTFRQPCDPPIDVMYAASLHLALVWASPGLVRPGLWPRWKGACLP